MQGDDLDCPSLCSPGNAMFDGVLDHRLQDEDGNLSAIKLLGNIHTEVQAIREPHLLMLRYFCANATSSPIGTHDAHTFSPERREEIVCLATKAIEAIDICDADALMNKAGNA